MCVDQRFVVNLTQISLEIFLNNYNLLSNLEERIKDELRENLISDILILYNQSSFGLINIYWNYLKSGNWGYIFRIIKKIRGKTKANAGRNIL